MLGSESIEEGGWANRYCFVWEPLLLLAYINELEIGIDLSLTGKLSLPRLYLGPTRNLNNRDTS